MKIFAYGSNMSQKRIKNRVPSATKVANGYIEGYKLKCTKQSIDGSGKATIIRTNDLEDRVWGVVFEIDENEKQSLDRAEGLNNGYNESNINITLSDSICSAQIYIADCEAINEELNPYDWYKTYITSGANENNLPKNYIETLETIQSVRDSNDERRKRNKDILNKL